MPSRRSQPPAKAITGPTVRSLRISNAAASRSVEMPSAMQGFPPAARLTDMARTLFVMRAIGRIREFSSLHHSHRAHQKLIGGFLLLVAQRRIKRINRALECAQGFGLRREVFFP